MRRSCVGPARGAAARRRGLSAWWGGCRGRLRVRAATVPAPSGPRPIVSANRSSFSSTRRLHLPASGPRTRARTTSGTSAISAIPCSGLVPADAEPAGQLGSQAGVVEGGQGALVELDRPGVQRQPPAIRGPHPVRDHQVGVELRIGGPAGVLTERRRDDPLGVDDRHLARQSGTGCGHGLRSTRPPRRPRRHGPARTSARVVSSPSAHRTDTDFGAEHVTSKPRTELSS